MANAGFDSGFHLQSREIWKRENVGQNSATKWDIIQNWFYHMKACVCCIRTLFSPTSRLLYTWYTSTFIYYCSQSWQWRFPHLNSPGRVVLIYKNVDNIILFYIQRMNEMQIILYYMVYYANQIENFNEQLMRIFCSACFTNKRSNFTMQRLCIRPLIRAYIAQCSLRSPWWPRNWSLPLFSHMQKLFSWGD